MLTKDLNTKQQSDQPAKPAAPKKELVGFLQPRVIKNEHNARFDFCITNRLEDNNKLYSSDFASYSCPEFFTEYQHTFRRFYQDSTYNLSDINQGKNSCVYNPHGVFLRHYTDGPLAIIRLAECQRFLKDEQEVKVQKMVHCFFDMPDEEFDVQYEMKKQVLAYINKLRSNLERVQSSVLLNFQMMDAKHAEAALDPHNVEVKVGDFFGQEQPQLSSYIQAHKAMRAEIDYLKESMCSHIDAICSLKVDDFAGAEVEGAGEKVIEPIRSNILKLSTLAHTSSVEEVPVLTARYVFEFETFNISVYDPPTIRYIEHHLDEIQHTYNAYRLTARWKADGVPESERTYRTKGKHDPFDHQHVMAKVHSMLPCSANLSDMGTGKTYGVLMAVDERINNGEVKPKAGKVLVVCPNTVVPNWIKQISLHTPHLTAEIVTGPFFDRMQTLLSSDKDILITNYETFSMFVGVTKEGNISKSRRLKDSDKKITAGDVIEKITFDLVVLDECHKIKNPAAVRTRAILKCLGGTEYKVIMTGTINANTAADIYVPFYFLTGGAQFSTNLQHLNKLGAYARDTLFDAFKDTYLSSGTGRYFATQDMKEVTKMMAPISVQFSKAECLDLPPKVYRSVYTDMHEKQRKLYNLLERQIMIELKEIANRDGYIRTTSTFGKIMKLSEAANGWLYDKDGDPVKFPWNPKIKAMMEVVDEINFNHSKLVVWCRFRNDLHMLTKELRDRYSQQAIACIHGGVRCKVCGSDTNVRFPTTERFNKLSGRLKIIVIDSSVGSHGIDLTGADYEIFYSNSYVKTDRSQAEDRCHREGMRESLTIIDMVMLDSIDEVILDAIQTHKSVTHAFMERLGKKEGLKWDGSKNMFVRV